MNSGRAKLIRKLIALKNPQVLLMLRNVYGERTAKMSYQQIVRAAKRLWKEKAPGTEKWPKRKELGAHEKKST